MFATHGLHLLQVGSSVIDNELEQVFPTRWYLFVANLKSVSLLSDYRVDAEIFSLDIQKLLPLTKITHHLII